MATTARQVKPARKGAGPEPTRNAWGAGARASPTFAAAPPAARPPSGSGFPPLSTPSNGTAKPEDAVLRSLSGLTGTTVTIITKTATRFEGVVGSTSGEGDTTGVTLKDAKEISTAGAPLKDSIFIAATNIDSWRSGPADSTFTNGDSFRTDTDISMRKNQGRERELQAWQPDAPAGPSDDLTFGPTTNNSSWDQFAVNENKFGVTTTFDEELYTTKLDRSGADYKEKERKAQRIAAEILGATSNNPHLAEERNQEDDSGINEEDKYGAVVRGQNAYVPPGARKMPAGSSVPATPAQPEVPKVAVNGPDGVAVPKAASPTPVGAKPPADAVPAFRDFVTSEKQRLAQKKQALVKNEMDRRMADLVKFSQSFKLNKPIPEDLVPILAKDEEKQRQIKDKATRDANSGVARAIGSSTAAAAPRAQGGKAVNLAEANRKMAAITKTAVVTAAPSAAQKPGVAAAKPGDQTKKVSMVIQSIPPFKGARKPTGPPAAPARAQNGLSPEPSLKTPTSPSARLNINASSFKPSPKGTTPSPKPVAAPSATASPKPKESVITNNPFFGNRVIKKTPAISLKDDFNPFKHNTYGSATVTTPTWTYNGKRFMSLYPIPHNPAPQHSPMVAPMPQPMAPPPYEEDPAAQQQQQQQQHQQQQQQQQAQQQQVQQQQVAQQQAARGGYVFYPHYGYPGQPMMAGMAPPGPPYMPPFMQPMPYPPGMPPNAMYAPPGMQMPPYMQAPPGAYPPANGAGPRGSMPPTPIPQHAHAYYQQSPQLQHAVPYQMMMAPPPGSMPHGYDTSQAPPPQAMGGHA